MGDRKQRSASEEGGREVARNILVAVFWIPIQITLSLIFATGGMFLLLVLGLVLSPFIGLFFLIRSIIRKA